MDVKQFTFDEQLDRLKEAAGVDTDLGLTSILGVRASGIYNARKERGKIPHKWLVTISTKYGVNLEWLVFGTGPRDMVKQSAAPGVCPQCTELQRQLTIANERLIQAKESVIAAQEREINLLKENSGLKEKIGKLEAELAELKNKQSSSDSGHGAMASAS